MKENGVNLSSDEIYHCSPTSKPVYKADIRKDRVINKAKAIRGTAKHEGKSMPRRTQTTKQSLENTCKFSITLKLEPGQFWYIPHQSTYCFCHNHAKMQPEELSVATNKLSTQHQQDYAMYQRFAHGGSVQNIMNQKTGGLCLSQSQARYNRQKHELAQGLDASDGLSNFSDLSPAQKLMAYLKQQKEAGKLRYIALFHEITETSLLTITKAQQKREAEKKKKREGLTQSQVLAEASSGLEHCDVSLSVTSISEAGNETTSQYQLESVLEKLALGETLAPLREQLTVGQRILLAVAWSREDEVRLFEMFPEVLLLDVTFQTNNEGRPLAVTACPDSNMESFVPVRVFMPSQCKWVFSWIFGIAIPTLLGTEALERTQLVLTDGDSKIYDAFEEHRQRFYPSAQHSLCMYHLVTKGIERIGSRLLGYRKSNLVMDQVNTFKHWCFSWMGLGGVESEAEYIVSLEALKRYLGDFSSSDSKELKHNAVVLEEFLSQTIEHHKSRWFFPGRAHLMTFNMKATSMLESVHHTMKVKSSKVVTPCMTMLESLQTQDDQAKCRMDKFVKKAARDAQSLPLWARGSPTASVVNKLCESQIQQNLDAASVYACRLTVEGTVEVVHVPDSEDAFCQECTTQTVCPLCCDQSPVCLFKRKRTIRFLPIDDGANYAVSCSCHYQPTMGIPCRHFARVLQVQPHHVHVRYWREYAALFNRNGFRKRTGELKALARDYRLKITAEEYKQLLENVKSEQWDDSFFDVPNSVCYQKTVNGLIPYAVDTTAHSAAYFLSHSIFDMGGFSQESGICDEQEEEVEEVDSLPNLPPVRSNNVYNDLCAQFAACMSLTENDSNVRRELVLDLYGVMSKFIGKLRVVTPNKSDSLKGQYVSMYQGSDKRKKSKRLVSATEPKRRRVIRDRAELTLENSLI
jgi:MULE transposase domain